MKKIFLSLIALAAFSIVFAQKEIKYATLYYKSIEKETDELKINIDGIVSTAEYTKFKLKITNNTGDFILFKTEDCKFIINGKEIRIKEKPMSIPPNDWDSKVIDVKHPDMNKVKSYSFALDGLSKVPSKGTVIEIPDFKLPPSQNDVEAGPFILTLGKWTKETQGTDVKFKVAYNGSNVGIVFANKLSATLPDGSEHATARSKMKPFLLMKGQDDTFYSHWERMEGGKATDMQKVTMMIKWNGTFVESTPVKLAPQSFEIEWDEALSNEKR